MLKGFKQLFFRRFFGSPTKGQIGITISLAIFYLSALSYSNYILNSFAESEGHLAKYKADNFIMKLSVILQEKRVLVQETEIAELVSETGLSEIIKSINIRSQEGDMLFTKEYPGACGKSHFDRTADFRVGMPILNTNISATFCERTSPTFGNLQATHKVFFGISLCLFLLIVLKLNTVYMRLTQSVAHSFKLTKACNTANHSIDLAGKVLNLLKDSKLSSLQSTYLCNALSNIDDAEKTIQRSFPPYDPNLQHTSKHINTTTSSFAHSNSKKVSAK